MSKLDNIIRDAKEELESWRKDNPSDDPDDEIHEIADSSVPVYNGDLLDIAAEDNEIALTTPELGPAFDGEATPVNIIAANIYEKVLNELWDHWRQIEEEEEDEG